MIEIICDQYKLYHATEADSLVTEADQFEDELAKIQLYAEAGDPLRIVVRNPVLFRYFDAAIKYGAQKQIINPVELLAGELKQTVVPQYLQAHPSWIVELDLLGKSKELPSNGRTIKNWLKRVLLGDLWTEKFPDSQPGLSALFAYFTDRDEQELHPLEKHLVEEYLQNWHRQNPDKEELLSWLKGDPFVRAKFIIWEQFLSLFPSNKVADWLQQDDIWFELSKYPNRIQLPRLSSSLQLPKKIAAFARSFLLGKWIISQEEAILFISGRLDFEKKFLLEQLRQLLRDETSISSSVYNALFSLDLQEVSSLAKQLIPAESPSALTNDNTVSDVQEWMENEYLPFYNSCSLLGQLDSTKPYLTNFEDWLVKHYKKMLFSGNGMAYRQIYQLKASADEPILMVVFDGLDYLCACEELLPIMQNNGLFPVNEPIPFFSFLPSQTEIAKPVLVAGKMKSQIPDEKPNADFYKKLLKTVLGLFEDDIRSKTDRDGTLLELIQDPAHIYLYLDNQLDREYLHTNLRQYSRKRKFSEYIQKQGGEIVQCLQDYKQMYSKSLKVVICSDHGYTTIPKTADVVKIVDGKKDKTRTLFSHEKKHIEGVGEQNIWKLHPDLYGLNEEIILPRGYSCFHKRPHGATHGGCSPQEMAVPWFLLSEESPAPFEPLSFSFEGEIFRKRAENSLILNISNPNNYPVKLSKMEVSGIETSSSFSIKIVKNNTHKLHASFNASAIGEKNVEFSIRYRVKSMAGEVEKSLILKVPTTGAMSTEFDDDFDI